METYQTWEEVEEKFERLVHYFANRVYRSQISVDSAITTDDLFHEGLMTMFLCWKKYQGKPKEEFDKIVKASIKRKIYSTCTKLAADSLSETTSDIVADRNLEYESERKDTMDDLRRDFEIISKNIENPIALAILHEMLFPSPKTLWHSWADRARRTTLRSQGFMKSVAKEAVVKKKHIRDALGITQKEMDYALRELKEESAWIRDSVDRFSKGGELIAAQ